MADQKKIDKATKKMSSIYVDGITNIVDNLLKSKEGMDNVEFGTALLGMDMKEIVKAQLSNINKEYVKAHIEILKDKKPINKK